MIDYFWNFTELFTESAPWLLLGLFIAGLMKWLVPMALLQKHMGDNSFFSVIKAALIGAPLPLCSCGVIPAAIGLRRAGASPSSTVSFLIATPETGVDSISVSYALLGPFFAIIRPIAAIFTAIYAGIMVKVFAIVPSKEADKLNCENNLNAQSIQSLDSSDCAGDNIGPAQTVAKSCCDSQAKLEKVAKKNEKEVKSSCCSSKTEAKTDDDSEVVKADRQQSCCSSQKMATSNDKAQDSMQNSLIVTRLKQSLAFSSGKLLSDLTQWLLIGLLLAAAIKTWVSTDFLTQWGDGFVAMLVMALVGIPMYICATASTPLAAGFLAAGLSPGAILVFMLAGPATNIATMGMIRKELGWRVLVAYLVSLFSASIAMGYLANWLIHQFNIHIPVVAAESHGMNESIVYQLSAILLAGLMVKNWIKR